MREIQCARTYAGEFHSFEKPRKRLPNADRRDRWRFDRIQHIYGLNLGDTGEENEETFAAESRFRRASERRSVLFFSPPFASMSVTRAICVIAASRQRYAIPSKPRNRTEKTGERNRTEKGRPTTKSGVYASLVSLMVTSRATLFHAWKKWMRACGLVSFARGNSLRDKSLAFPHEEIYPAHGFMKYGRVDDFESDTIPISNCDLERLNWRVYDLIDALWATV